MTRSFWVGLVLTVVLLAASAARAHGQFPLPLQTFLNPQGVDPLAWATFGLLQPRTDGVSFDWICEEMAGGNVNTAPVFVRTSSGTLMGGARDRLLRFSADRCAAALVETPADRGVLRALGAHAAEPWVAAGVGSGAVLWSTDDGVTFSPTALSEDGAIPTRILVEGTAGTPVLTVFWRFYSDGHTELVRSAPDGTGLTRVPITDARAPFFNLLTRDPMRAGQMYMRDDGLSQDRLLRVDEATGTVTTVLLEAADDLTLAVSPDGTHVAMGGLATPLQVSSNGGATFETRTALNQVRNATWGADNTLYVAADNWRDGFAFGRSTDLGVSFSGMGRFEDILGVHTCDSRGPGCELGADAGCTSGTGNDVVASCAHLYPALRVLFGVGVDGGTMEPGSGGGSSGGTVSGGGISGCPGCSAGASANDVGGFVVAWAAAGLARLALGSRSRRGRSLARSSAGDTRPHARVLDAHGPGPGP